ncbi:uncharacterized protein HMPREF1541_06406 [Cyphellophora europaea CBS 101466]|uniref:Uncharacterized protein n=1 Tax=Cyphellophora europaea (strain CBS 101466) TaxID=1220924 RepID=W2RPF4_CYPE1|nr:uncharacterized protein HMPREF1541_06406 [Cyphellophora europaea CBS 101466]ETN38371.1 hypothetical protein HMPREF1541_06406 [Cyphellophora europaea CBS 101466]
MINWNKFKDPHSAESACLSDTVYPLSQSIVAKVEPVDHTGILMSSDMLLNADDRRFALAQSSPSRRVYDFRTNKVNAIDGAIVCLSNYIDRREASYNLPAPPLRYPESIRQDLAGMPALPLDQDQISECCLSPSPPPVQLINHGYIQRSSDQSTAHPTSITSVASSKASSTNFSFASTSYKASTAPTNISHGLSIADLIHPPLVIPPPSTRLSSPMTPDPEVDYDTHNHHLPNQAFLQATLASIRSSRGISESRYSLNTRRPRISSPPLGCARGRSLKMVRMRRSSRTRRSKQAAAHCLGDSTTASSTLEGQSFNSSQPRIQDHETLPPSVEPDASVSHPAHHQGAASTLPSPLEAQVVPSKPMHATPTSLDRWWHAERLRHSCDEYADQGISSSPPEVLPATLSGLQRSVVPGLDFSREGTYDNGHHPLAEPEGAIEADDDVASQGYSTGPEHGLYAYTRDWPNLRFTSPRAKSYGYIAGDVPGARESKIRTRGRVRERTRGRSKEAKGGQEEDRPRVVSGVKRQRDDSSGGREAEGCASKAKHRARERQETVQGRRDSTQRLQLPAGIDDEALNEDDLRDIREAQMLAERWWKDT